MQRMSHQAEWHTIQLCRILQWLGQCVHNAALGVLKPIVTRLLVCHYCTQQRLDSLHKQVIQRLSEFELGRDGLQVVHVELWELVAIIECTNLSLAHIRASLVVGEVVADRVGHFTCLLQRLLHWELAVAVRIGWWEPDAGKDRTAEFWVECRTTCRWRRLWWWGRLSWGRNS